MAFSACTPVVREYKDLKSREYRRYVAGDPLPVYRGDSLRQIRFPSGGIGQGNIRLGGRGEFQAFDIPGAAWKAVPDLCFFAIHAQEAAEFNTVETVEFEPVLKILEQVLYPDEGRAGEGPLQQEGIPRCMQVSFTHRYPFGYWTIEDPDLPVRPELEVFSPLIPTDLYHSSLPVSYLHWKIHNPLQKKVRISLAFALSSPFAGPDAGGSPSPVTMQGVRFEGGFRGLILSSGRAEFCVAAPAETRISILSGQESYHALLHRFWGDFRSGGEVGRSENNRAFLQRKKAQMAVFRIEQEIGPGNSLEFPLLLSWNPQPEYLRGHAEIPANALGLASYAIREREGLHQKTEAFTGNIAASSYPAPVIEALLASFCQLQQGTLARDWIYSPLPVWMYPQQGRHLSEEYLLNAREKAEAGLPEAYASQLMHFLSLQLDSGGASSPAMTGILPRSRNEGDAITALLQMAATLSNERDGDKTSVEQLRSSFENLYWNGEYYSLTGSGECHSDQLLGQALAWNVGLDTLLSTAHLERSLSSIFRYNYRQSWSGQLNIGSAGIRNREGGLVLCTWPHGNRPAMPLPRSDEVWAGPELGLSGMLIRTGMIDDGLAVLQTSRRRFQGFNRNPLTLHKGPPELNRSAWEIHLALSGYRYDARKRSISLHPRINADQFTCTWMSDSGWGRLKLTGTTLEIKVDHGTLKLAKIRLSKDYGYRGVLSASQGSPTVEITGETIMIDSDPGWCLEEGSILSLEFRK